MINAVVKKDKEDDKSFLKFEEPKKEDAVKKPHLFNGFRGKSVIIERPDTIPQEEPVIIKPKRKRRKINTEGEGEDDDKQVAEILSGNTPIIDSYSEVIDMTKQSIGQLSQLQNELKFELDQIRSSSMRGKYQHLSDLSAVISSIASTKLSAIKELDSIITTSNKMEISRVKDLKIESNDDSAVMMGLYENIINKPRTELEQNVYIPRIDSADVNMPSLMTSPTNLDIIPHLQEPNDSFSPEENRMIAEKNPDIKTVVIYDKNTDIARFEVMNMATNKIVDGVSKPDPFLLEGMRFDFKNGFAKNSNINATFPMIVVGETTGEMITPTYGGNF